METDVKEFLSRIEEKVDAILAIDDDETPSDEIMDLELALDEFSDIEKNEKIYDFSDYLIRKIAEKREDKAYGWYDELILIINESLKNPYTW